MSAYDLVQVIRMWETAKLTTEQAIGQILLHIQALAERIDTLEQRTEQMTKPPDSSPPEP